MALARPPEGAAPAPAATEPIYGGFSRFELELEVRTQRKCWPWAPPDRLQFVQCLANPWYLNHLAAQKYLDNPDFVAYLDYLQYFAQPQYAKYLTYVIPTPALFRAGVELTRCRLAPVTQVRRCARCNCCSKSASARKSSCRTPWAG